MAQDLAQRTAHAVLLAPKVRRMIDAVGVTIAASAFVLGLLVGVSLFVMLYKNGYLDGDDQ